MNFYMFTDIGALSVFGRHVHTYLPWTCFQAFHLVFVLRSICLFARSCSQWMHPPVLCVTRCRLAPLPAENTGGDDSTGLFRKRPTLGGS